VSLLVRLGPLYGDNYTLSGELEVTHIQSDEFAAPKCTGESREEYRAVSLSEVGRRKDADHCTQLLSRKRKTVVWCNSVRPADTRKDLPNYQFSGG
jgi:hypothetical protein